MKHEYQHEQPKIRRTLRLPQMNKANKRARRYLLELMRASKRSTP